MKFPVMEPSLSKFSAYESLNSEFAKNGISKKDVSVANPVELVDKGERIVAIYSFPKIKRPRNNPNFGRSISCEFLSKKLQDLCHQPCTGHPNLTNSSANEIVGNSPRSSTISTPGITGTNDPLSEDPVRDKPAAQDHFAKSSTNLGISLPFKAVEASRDTKRSLCIGSQTNLNNISSSNHLGGSVTTVTYNCEDSKTSSHWIIPNRQTPAPLSCLSEHFHDDRQSSWVSIAEGLQADYCRNEDHSFLALRNSEILKGNCEKRQLNKSGDEPKNKGNTSNHSTTVDRQVMTALHEFSYLSKLRKIFYNGEDLREKKLNKNLNSSSQCDSHKNGIGEYASPIFSFEKPGRFVDVYWISDDKACNGGGCEVKSANEVEEGEGSEPKTNLDNHGNPSFTDSLPPKRKKAGMVIHLLCFGGLILYSYTVLFLLLYTAEQRKRLWETIQESGKVAHEEEKELNAAIVQSSRLVLWWRTIMNDVQIV